MFLLAEKIWLPFPEYKAFGSLQQVLRQASLGVALFQFVFLKFLENRDISLTKFGSAMLLLVLSEKQRDSLDLVFYSKLFLLSEKIRSMITMTQTLKHCQLLEECSLQEKGKRNYSPDVVQFENGFFCVFPIWTRSCCNCQTNKPFSRLRLVLKQVSWVAFLRRRPFDKQFVSGKFLYNTEIALTQFGFLSFSLFLLNNNGNHRPNFLLKIFPTFGKIVYFSGSLI